MQAISSAGLLESVHLEDEMRVTRSQPLSTSDNRVPAAPATAARIREVCFTFLTLMLGILRLVTLALSVLALVILHGILSPQMSGSVFALVILE